MPTLYVVRHALPAVGGVLLGQSDPPLGDTGLQQASELKAAIPVTSPVYCSPLRRALQTAYCICATPIIIPELAEISYGEWDGLSWADIENKWPSVAREKLRDWEQVNSPGGEAWDSFHSRVYHALELIRHGVLPAVLIAHEAVNAILLHELCGTDVKQYTQKHCEIMQVDLPFTE
jgi:broad specificity phosphatase PhoE